MWLVVTKPGGVGAMVVFATVGTAVVGMTGAMDVVGTVGRVVVPPGGIQLSASLALEQVSPAAIREG